MKKTPGSDQGLPRDWSQFTGILDHDSEQNMK